MTRKQTLDSSRFMSEIHNAGKFVSMNHDFGPGIVVSRTLERSTRLACRKKGCSQDYEAPTHLSLSRYNINTPYTSNQKHDRAWGGISIGKSCGGYSRVNLHKLACIPELFHNQLHGSKADYLTMSVSRLTTLPNSATLPWLQPWQTHCIDIEYIDCVHNNRLLPIKTTRRAYSLRSILTFQFKCYDV